MSEAKAVVWEIKELFMGSAVESFLSGMFDATPVGSFYQAVVYIFFVCVFLGGLISVAGCVESGRLGILQEGLSGFKWGGHSGWRGPPVGREKGGGPNFQGSLLLFLPPAEATGRADPRRTRIHRPD